MLQSDFGVTDGAVSTMYGVAYNVSQELIVEDLTHNIEPYNIWEASYRLVQTITYWPEETVFVSVVDPGVGSNRKSIVAKTKTNHYIVSPNNGSLTHINKIYGIEEIREIDENINRLPRSGESYTFHGRDIYAYTGARLAAGVIDFAGVGKILDISMLVELPVIDPKIIEDGALTVGTNASALAVGTIDVLDIRYGSLWTNIPREFFVSLLIKHGDLVEVSIENSERSIYKNILVYAKSFADVNVGEQLVYVNSLDRMAVAINQGSFAKAYNIGTGTSWIIKMKKGPVYK